MQLSEKEFKEQFYKKASEVKTPEELTTLLKEITEFNHDYGTIVYGCTAAMKAAMNVVNRSPQGGITGFQAGCMGWEMIKELMGTTPNAPLKLTDYHNMLYPQYADKFEKRISTATWEYLQLQAAENLEKNGISTGTHPNVVAHWVSIKDGKIPFGYVVRDE